MVAYIERRKSGYRVQVRRRGLPSISRTFDLLVDAQTWAREVERELQRGNSAVLRQAAQKTSVAEAIDAYLRGPKFAALRSQKGVALYLKAARDALGALYLSNLRALDVAAWRDKLLAGGLGPASVRLHLAALSAVISYSEKELGIDLPAGNPVRSISKPSPAPGRDRRLLAGEARALLDAAENDDQRAILQLALETSMRLGEMIGLRWEHVDLRQRTAHLPRTKNGESRTVALSSAAVAALQSLPRRVDGRVFRWATTGGFESVWRRWRDRARRQALLARLQSALDAQGIDGAAEARALVYHKRIPDPRAATLWEQLLQADDPFLSNLHFHDLRHEATSRLFEKGLGVMEVASMTGHKSLAMLKRYTHVEAAKLAQKLG